MSGAVIVMSPDLSTLLPPNAFTTSLRLLASKAALFQSANADVGSTPALMAAATRAKLAPLRSASRRPISKVCIGFSS